MILKFFAIIVKFIFKLYIKGTMPYFFHLNKAKCLASKFFIFDEIQLLVCANRHYKLF